MRTRFLFLLLAFLPLALRAQEAQHPTTQEPSEIAVAALQARLDALQADTTVPAEQKTPIVEVLQKAIEHATATDARQQTRAAYEARRTSAADRLTQRRADLQALDAIKPGPQKPDLTLPELEQGLAAAQTAQTAAQKQVTELEAERARRVDRRTAIPNQITEWRGKLDALPTQPPEVPGTDPRLANARRLALLAERARDAAEIATLTEELQTYDAEADLQRAEADLAARRVATTKADAEGWLLAVQPKRAEAAKAAEDKAKQEARERRFASPEIQALAKSNTGLAAELQTLAAKRATAEQEKAERDKDLADLEKEFKEVQDRVVKVHGGDAIGILLRRQRAKLAETSRKHQQRTLDRGQRISDAQLKQLDYGDERARLVEDPDGWLTKELGLDPKRQDAAEITDMLATARPLRDAHRDLLQQLADGYDSLFKTEVAVDTTEKDLTEKIRSYRAFITESVLGLRSSPPLWQLDWHAARASVAWLVHVGQWTAVGQLTWNCVVLDTWPLLLLLLLLAILLLRRRWSNRLVVHGERAARGTNVAYLPTALGTIDTLLLALPIPLMLGLWSWRLTANAGADEFAKAVAAGAWHTTWALLLVLALRQMVRARGLAEAHFQWQTTTIALLRRTVPLLLLSVVPFSFLLGMLELATDDAGLGSLGGPLLLVQLAILVLVFARLLNPTRGLIGGGVKSTSALYRFRRVWYFFGVAIPLTLLTMVVLGYEYTVLQLTRRFYLTVGVVVAGVLLHALILRGLLLERRRLQMRRAQERLQAARSGETAAAEAAGADERDPQSLARQTQTLLSGAIVIVVAVVTFQVWVDVMPALGILRRFPLWDVGTPDEITLADLLLGLFVFMASLVAARNLPALLELLVLQRLRMQAGERNAITTLTRYLIFIVGLSWSFHSVGVGWNKVQWLLAAMSVGLGFGLQEIFANFVSGLILLFERPMRVGDLVTVGTTTGRVTRIRIRATTVQDFDKKELVVPNREFVTGQFTNWTLGDSLVRWTLPVGVAYGTDTERALRLLEKVARESRFVVNTPGPEAVFVGFGDSTLNLELRLFVDMNSLEYRWMTEIYQGIDLAYREAGIEIAFPQRDVNLKLPSPLQAWLLQAGGATNVS